MMARHALRDIHDLQNHLLPRLHGAEEEPQRCVVADKAGLRVELPNVNGTLTLIVFNVKH